MIRSLSPLLAAFFLPGAASAQDDPLRFGAADGPSLSLQPFVQVDARLADRAPDGLRAEETDLNLARLYAVASAGDATATLAYEFQDGGRWRYAYLTYAATERLSVVVGQQDEPFSLADMSGSRAAIFADSAAATALVPGDNIGVRADYDGGAFTLSGGVFGGDIDTGAGDEGTAYAARATWNPTGDPQDGAPVLHLGLAAATRDGADFNAGLATGAGAGLLPRSLLSVGAFDDVDQIDRINLEVAARTGPLSFQAEASGARIDRGGDTREAQAAYALLSWYVTGESRPYDAGTFGQVTPLAPVPGGGRGAVELALRLDAADFEADGETIRVTGAVNWHVTRALRVGLNASHAEVEDGVLGDGDVSVAFLRLQYAH